MREEQVKELLLQALETERGGVDVYEAAIACAQNGDLREEWSKYLDQTRRHAEVVRGLCETFGVDPEEESPGRVVVRHIGKSLVGAMQRALEDADGAAAQLVASECVVLAETKDHLNWELLEQISKESRGKRRQAVEAACQEVENQEDRHLYHTQGWSRELWLESLGLPAVLPPPEEEQDVETAIEAAEAKQGRSEML